MHEYLSNGSDYMIYWIYMFIIALIMPVIMIIFGNLFLHSTPKDINIFWGYRTPMSVKNIQTWRFAHNCCGKIWRKWGVITGIAAIIIMTCFIGKSESTIGAVCGILSVIELVIVVASIFITEKELRKNFDKTCTRR